MEMLGLWSGSCQRLGADGHLRSASEAIPGPSPCSVPREKSEFPPLKGPAADGAGRGVRSADQGPHGARERQAAVSGSDVRVAEGQAVGSGGVRYREEPTPEGGSCSSTEGCPCWGCRWRLLSLCCPSRGKEALPSAATGSRSSLRETRWRFWDADTGGRRKA